MCIHYQPDRNGQQDQCVVNQRDDYTHHGERFYCLAYTISHRVCAHRNDSLRRRKCCSNDSEPHNAEEYNDIIILAEYSAHAEEEQEGCSGNAYDIYPDDRLLQLFATSDWYS